jgi:hypothetical protein
MWQRNKVMILTYVIAAENHWTRRKLNALKMVADRLATLH